MLAVVGIVEVVHQLQAVIDDGIAVQDLDHQGTEIEHIVIVIASVNVTVIQYDLIDLVNVIHDHVLHHQKHSVIKLLINVLNQPNESSTVRKKLHFVFYLLINSDFIHSFGITRKNRR